MTDDDILKKVRLRDAVSGDAKALSSLAFRSKAHWGYDIEFMKRCRDELTYSEVQIESPQYRFRVVELDGEIVAFSALELLGDAESELEALFVRPDCIGKGIGRLLVERAMTEAAILGVRRITIQGDPNADDFYLAIGGKPSGYRESASIPGRYLPVYTLTINEGE